jgi:hypothetical protein
MLKKRNMKEKSVFIPLPGRWSWLHQLLHDNRGVRYFVAAVAIIIATGLGLLAMLAQYEDPIINDIPFVTKKVVVKKFYSPLTGEEVPDEAATKRAVTAIMIENSPDARTQSGIKQAGVVFEAIAEGGITRFACLYQQAQPGLVGPVRSLRPYYIDWIAPFEASVAHVGGSYNALQEIRNGSYRDIDQFFNSGAYWRASDRYAPHNVYTSFERLNALNEAKGYKESTFTGFLRRDPALKPFQKQQQDKSDAALPTAKAVDVTVSSTMYNIRYDYDPASKTYARSQGGQVHEDREEGGLSPRVVIVVKVPMHKAFEDGYREQMDTIGSGEAFIFQNGTVRVGIWKKDDKKSQLRFVDASTNKDIPLEAGQTWITATAPERSVSWQ